MGRDAADGGETSFLLTDVVGSVRLWEQHPGLMAGVMAEHDAVVAAAVEAHAGAVVRSRGEGDSIFAVFADAADAVTCACRVQRDVAAHAWPRGIELRLRAAVSTGESQVREGEHYGETVNRCARLRSVCPPGQVLVGERAAEAARDRLPADITLRDLGHYRLRDLSRPERVHQLLHAALPDEGVRLSTNHNLPAPVSRFIGRERQLEEVADLLGRSRLLTLTGAGGCGKSRLATEYALDHAADYADGAWLVDLAGLADPDLIAATAASVLAVPEEPGRALVDTLGAWAAQREVLLLIDNCEHLLAGAGQFVAALLRGSPRLRVVATSREPLGVPGETTYRVPSMAMPAPDVDDASSLLQSEAVRLFVDRAVALEPAFAVDDADAGAIGEICRRLDGIPLAIELAAARVKVLSPAQIAAKLSDRFRLLTGGSRLSLPRQQTLLATVNWSHDLLDGEEATLLRRLSVFAGGWSLDAAEAVCEGEPIEAVRVLDVIEQLVAKSLVVADTGRGPVRYHMLETIREFARQKLIESGEADGLRGRHLDWFLAMAERTEQDLLHGSQVSWPELDADHDNLRAALEWSLVASEGKQPALRLAGALTEFWDLRCFLAEGRRWLELALAHDADAPPPSRAKALCALGLLVSHQGDYATARGHFAEGLELARTAGDSRIVATGLGSVGWLEWSEGNNEVAQRHLEEGVDLARELGDRWLLARALYLLCHVFAAQNSPLSDVVAREALGLARELGEKSIEGRGLYFLGVTAIQRGEYDAARALLEQSVALAREVGDRWQAPWSLSFIGAIGMLTGHFDEALPALEESLEISRETGNTWCTARCLATLSWVRLLGGGDLEAAEALALQSLDLSRSIGARIDTGLARTLLGEFARVRGNAAAALELHAGALDDAIALNSPWSIASCLDRLARLALDAGADERATMLLAAAAAMREDNNCAIPPISAHERERCVEAARGRLSEAEFEAAWSGGRALSLEAARRIAVAA